MQTFPGRALSTTPSKSRLTFPANVCGRLYVHVFNWNGLNRSDVIAVDDQEYDLGAHAGAGGWPAFDVGQRETYDGEILLLARPMSGPNLMVTELALVLAG